MIFINPKHIPLVLSHPQTSLFPKTTVLQLPNLLLLLGQGDSWTDFQFESIPQLIGIDSCLLQESLSCPKPRFYKPQEQQELKEFGIIWDQECSRDHQGRSSTR